VRTPTSPNPSPQRGTESVVPGAGRGGTPQAEEQSRRVTLVESDTRKSAFLREVVRQTGIGAGIAVDILSTRAESLATQANFPLPEVVCARALAPLERLLWLALPLFTPATVGVFLKGKEARLELEAAEKAWKFNVDLVQSRTDPNGSILLIRNPELKTKD
jgi:16S rRNA (guanine527-N7)-methyltransferase